MRAILLGPVHPCGHSTKQSDSTLETLLRQLPLMSTDVRIGVDGGVASWLKLGLKPHFAVGDWDSLPMKQRKKALADVPHLTVSRHKDRSDLFYACMMAIQAGASELICAGVTGADPAHHLAALLDLSTYSAGEFGKLRRVAIIGYDAHYEFLSGKAIPKWPKELQKFPKLKIGQRVSFFAMGGDAEGVTLKGFRYQLKNARIVPSSHGLSNVVKSKNIEVSLRNGRLLVIISKNVIS